MQRIAVLKNNGVTGAMVAFSWLGRQIQPLQKHCHARFEYSGLDDPSRFSSGVIHPNEAMAILNDIVEGVDSVPELSKLYRRKYPPNSVILSGCFCHVLSWLFDASVSCL